MNLTAEGWLVSSEFDSANPGDRACRRGVQPLHWATGCAAGEGALFFLKSAASRLSTLKPGDIFACPSQ